MILHSTAFRGTVLASVLALAACSMNPMGSHAPKFTAKLSGTQEVPPNASPGTGALEASFNRDTSVLKWTVSYSGLTGPVTGAHFHGPATPGQNAGVVLPFSGSLVSAIQGEAKLTPAQAEDLTAGRWYANLHTAAYPGGEIRGQVLPKR